MKSTSGKLLTAVLMALSIGMILEMSYRISFNREVYGVGDRLWDIISLAFLFFGLLNIFFDSKGGRT